MIQHNLGLVLLLPLGKQFVVIVASRQSLRNMRTHFSSVRCTSSNISCHPCHHCHLLVIMSCFSTLTMSRDLRVGRSQESHGVTTCHSVSASKTGRRCYEMQNVQPRMKTRKIYRFGLQYKYIYIPPLFTRVYEGSRLSEALPFW